MLKKLLTVPVITVSGDVERTGRKAREISRLGDGVIPAPLAQVLMPKGIEHGHRAADDECGQHDAGREGESPPAMFGPP